MGRAWPADARWEEILLRTRNGVSPSAVFARARRGGYGPLLDAQVVNRALAALAADPSWARASINATAASVCNHASLSGWLGAIEAWGVSPARVCVELPEHLPPPTDLRARTGVRRLHQAGLILALDDVGSDANLLRWCDTGYISVLKADKTVLHHDEAGTPDGARGRLLEGLAALAQRMGLELVVEGVETSAQCERARSLGEDVVAQGRYLAPPRPLRVPGWTPAIGACRTA